MTQMKQRSPNDILHLSLKGIAATTVRVHFNKSGNNVRACGVVFLVKRKFILRYLRDLTLLEINVSALDALGRYDSIAFDALHVIPPKVRCCHRQDKAWHLRDGARRLRDTIPRSSP